MRKTLSAAVLVLTFCCPVSAGIIHNPPPEPPPTLEASDAADAEMCGAETAAPGVWDGLTETSVDLLLTILPALF
jgi:hypothetical protein